MMNSKLCAVSMCVCVLLFCVLTTYGQKSNQPHQNQSWHTNDGVSVDEPVAVNTYCDSLLNYIEVNLMSEYPFISVFDEKKNIKYMIVDYHDGGRFLEMIQLPFGPEQDPDYRCTKKILDIFTVDYERPINQKGTDQIKWLIKNSLLGMRDRKPSDWISDFDTTFQPYCSVFSSSVFSELGLDQTKWGRAYYPPAGYCDSHEKCPEEIFRFDERGRGVIFCYLNYRHRHSIENSMIIEIPISENITLYQTQHGVLLRKDNLYRWVYHSDKLGRMRLPSINKVTVTNGRINVFLENNNTKPLSFLLKDLLK